jgi:3-hydroxyisobutyrate dehydrogenase
MTERLSLSLAVVGLGSMGLGMAASLARAGAKVAGCDVNPAALAEVAKFGRAAESPAEAARGAAALISVVVNASQTRQILFGEKGATETLSPGSIVISCATMSAQEAREIGAACAARGFLYLDAPISGGAAKAASGELTIMASGSPEAFAAAEPILAATAAKVYRLGAEPGLGSSYKLVNQLLAGVHIAAACEALVFASRIGLDLRTVYEVITASAGNSWMFENRAPHVLDGDYSPRSAVSIFTKDLGIVSDMGRSAKFPLPMTSTALQMFLMTAAAGMERDDDASVARMLGRLAGVELPAKGE